MEISLLQAFALGIIAFIAGLDMFNGLTHMHRPVVLGPLVGLVLGDLHTGILTGGTLELVWMGLAPLVAIRYVVKKCRCTVALSVPRLVGWRAVRCLLMRQCAIWSS